MPNVTLVLLYSTTLLVLHNGAHKAHKIEAQPNSTGYFTRAPLFDDYVRWRSTRTRWCRNKEGTKGEHGSGYKSPKIMAFNSGQKRGTRKDTAMPAVRPSSPFFNCGGDESNGLYKAMPNVGHIEPFAVLERLLPSSLAFWHIHIQIEVFVCIKLRFRYTNNNRDNHVMVRGREERTINILAIILLGCSLFCGGSITENNSSFINISLLAALHSILFNFKCCCFHSLSRGLHLPPHATLPSSLDNGKGI